LFFEFVKQQATDVGDGTPYSPLVTDATQLLLEGMDLRDEDNMDNAFKKYLFTTYLPLASQTQFVEAAVKEAKIVLQSDCSETLRSAYAVNRLATVHSVGVLRELSSVERIKALMDSAQKQYERHVELKASQVDYQVAVDAIATNMRKDHYREERLEALKQTVVDKGATNKKANAIQKKTGVDRTNQMEGLVSYGKVYRRLHMDDLEVELLHRGCTAEVVKAMTGIRERKDKLRQLEVARVKEQGGNIACAEKAFTPLSTAPFQVA
jgi:hypothetical protein